MTVMHVRRAVVAGLSGACTVVDNRRWWPFGCLLATWSDRLDQRWQTGVWTDQQEAK